MLQPLRVVCYFQNIISKFVIKKMSSNFKAFDKKFSLSFNAGLHCIYCQQLREREKMQTNYCR